MKGLRIEKLIAVSIIALIFQSCGLTVGKIQRNCDKFQAICKPDPVIIVKDSIVYENLIIYRDTTITLPGIVDTEKVEVPVFIGTDGKSYTRDTITVHNKYATASAWLTDGYLHLALYQDSAIQVTLKNALRDANYYRYQYTREVEKAKTGPKNYLWVLWIALSAILLFILVKKKVI